jgi:hypothetical protein
LYQNRGRRNVKKVQRLLLITFLVFLAGYFIVKGSDMLYEHFAGLDKSTKVEKKITPQEQIQEKRPSLKNVDAPVKEI